MSTLIIRKIKLYLVESIKNIINAFFMKMHNKAYEEHFDSYSYGKIRDLEKQIWFEVGSFQPLLY